MTPFYNSDPHIIYENITNCKIQWQGNIDANSKVNKNVYKCIYV